jgi:hypothetical protein
MDGILVATRIESMVASLIKAALLLLSSFSSIFGAKSIFFHIGCQENEKK